jgi:hypothetical protein
MTILLLARSRQSNQCQQGKEFILARKSKMPPRGGSGTIVTSLINVNKAKRFRGVRIFYCVGSAKLPPCPRRAFQQQVGENREIESG